MGRASMPMLATLWALLRLGLLAHLNTCHLREKRTDLGLWEIGLEAEGEE
jgi:hypothetical protein